MIVQVIQTKKEKPAPADVVKTAATQLGKVVPYMSAYQALKSKTREQKQMQTKNFQLINPYLQALKNANDGLVIGFSRNSQNCMTAEIHVFPGFMNKSLSFVHPLVSLNAAHLNGVYKGTMYVASVLSGANDLVAVINFDAMFPGVGSHGIRYVLHKCGITDLTAQTRLIEYEGIETVDGLASFTDTEIDTMADRNNSKRTPVAICVQFGMARTKTLKAITHWVRKKIREGSDCDLQEFIPVLIWG